MLLRQRPSPYLNMALSGIRDMSAIENRTTAGRQTYVMEYNDR
ncbi:MAG: hypothetical protein ACLTF5_08530 [Butyricicoccus sp.]